MYYKLFIFGESKVLAIVELPGGEFMKSGDMFLFKNVRYKILWNLRQAKEIEFDEKGKRKYQHYSDDQIALAAAELPEMYITECPSF